MEYYIYMMVKPVGTIGTVRDRPTVCLGGRGSRNDTGGRSF